MFHKALRPCKSSPNLSDDIQDRGKRFRSPVKFINRSVECVNSPPFRNPHKALNDLFKKFATNDSSFKRSFSLRERKLKRLEDIYIYCNRENTFVVKLHKNSNGLGMCIYGGRDASKKDPFHQFIRIGNLHPQQPALESGKLTLGDVILQVNGTSVLGLSSTEAVDVLRNAPDDVELKIFRPSMFLLPSVSEFKEGACSDSNCSSSCASKVDLRAENDPYTAVSGEIQVTLTKQFGCLGFSIVRIENSKDVIGGIFIKALTRAHAVSDGRIRAGDRILQVNGTDISTFTHSEAINCLRNAPDTVTLSLCRSCSGKSPCPKHSLPKVYSFNVTIDKCQDEKFGFAVWDSIENNPNSEKNILPCAVEVKDVFPGSLAHKNGIKKGDRILEVNGDSLLGKTADDVVEILQKANGVIRMVFCRLSYACEQGLFPETTCSPS